MRISRDPGFFLASKAADFVNGHVLYVDGGITANFGYVKGENDA